MDPKPAYHKALAQHLSARYAAGDLSAPPYDAVVQGAKLPYVTIDSSTSDEADMLSERRDDVFTLLTIWSDTPGQHEVIKIMAELDSVLDRHRLPLDTGRVATMRVRRTSTHREPDNVTFQGRMTLLVELDR